MQICYSNQIKRVIVWYKITFYFASYIAFCMILARPLNVATISGFRSSVNHKLKEFCIYRGVSEIVYLKKPHKWTEELIIGYWKVYCMERFLTNSPIFLNLNESCLKKKLVTFFSTPGIFPCLPSVDKWVMLGLPSISESGMVNVVAKREELMYTENVEPKAPLLDSSLSKPI